VQLLGEAVTAILHLEQVEPVGEPMVSREPYMRTPSGTPKKATLAFKDKLRGGRSGGEVTVYCVKFNPAVMTVGQDFSWPT